jgi:hypothetical protein
MGALHPRDFASLVAHYLEQQSGLPQKLDLGDILKKYQIYEGPNWVNNMIYQGIPYLDRKSITSREVFEISIDRIGVVEGIILEKIGATVLKADHKKRIITTDAAAPSLVPRPDGWQFLDADEVPIASNPIREFDRVINDLAPSLNDLILLNQNDQSVKDMTGALDEAIDGIRSSNYLNPLKKSDFAFDLEVGLRLLKKSGDVSIGAIKFLVLDRLKEAYKEATEELLKNSIKLAFFAIGLYFLGQIKI